MAGLLDLIDIEQSIDVRDLPYFRPTTAPGHRGRVVCGRLHGVPVIALDGRNHLYEGHSLARIQFPIHVLQQLGARVLIATNAAGGLNPTYEVGDVMVLDNHIDLMSPGNRLALIVDRLSKMSGATGSASAYSRATRVARPASDGRRSLQHARHNRTCTTPTRPERPRRSTAGFTAHRGTYIGVTGPNYETRAEYRLFRSIGGDAVGMSTVPEVRAAAALGMQTLALSVITNVCNPDALQPANAASVIQAAESAQAKVRAILGGVFHSLDSRLSTLDSPQHKTQ
jgi:purine-nucleoside phosphorylase